LCGLPQQRAWTFRAFPDYFSHLMDESGDRLTGEASTLTASGWALRLGAFSSSPQTSEGTDICAVYSGEKFERPARGILAIVARGVGAGPRAQQAAHEAAHVAIHLLVEGYFGAAATLSVGRAAALALTSANTWMFSQSRMDREHAMRASLAALIFAGRRVGIVNIGDCRVYRLRQGQLTPLTEDHTRPLANGITVLTRSVGGDAELHIDYSEDEPQVSDRYIVLSKGAYAGVAQLTDKLVAQASPDEAATSLAPVRQAGDSEQDATAVVIDVEQIPESNFDELSAAFQNLPLRGAPRDGENWDGFVLGRTLYRSRYTTLKLAHDTVNDREVVLKIPLPSMLHDQVFRAGFLREAWVGATVHSPRIASYIDVRPDRRSSLYLVLPYYHGETLEARLTRPPPISYLDGIGLALKLCAAIQDLAAYQIVHRDLKPDNVLLLSGGEIKLIDLGMAYLPGIDEPDDDRLGGTTRYMAPELFRKVPADQCSEVFSLGVTVYRVFSGGAFPFGQRETVPLQRLRPDLPAWIGECLKKALESDRGKRFQNAGEFAKALEQGLNQANLRTPETPQFAIPSRAWRIAPVRLWQGLALLFAAAFLVTLVLLLRR
jgi:serine/threonine protein phosphatase PrpC